MSSCHLVATTLSSPCPAVLLSPMTCVMSTPQPPVDVRDNAQVIYHETSFMAVTQARRMTSDNVLRAQDAWTRHLSTPTAGPGQVIPLSTHWLDLHS